MAEQTTTAAAYAGTSDDEFDSLLEGAALPEQPVRLCLDGKLRREYEEVKAGVEQRAAERDAVRAAAAAADQADARLVTKGRTAAPADERDPEQDTLDVLAARMRAKLVTFVVRAMSSTEYNRLLEQHPPRKDPATGRIDPRDYNGYNSSTFPAALVRKCIAQPTMTDERWAKVEAVITDAQFDKLFNAAATVNRRDEDIPF